MQQGSLLTFDVRQPAMPLTSYSPPPGVPPTPLHTLVAVPTGGLLTATFTAVVAWRPPRHGGGNGGSPSGSHLGSQDPTTWQARTSAGRPAHPTLIVHPPQPRVLVEAPAQCTAMAAQDDVLIASVRQSSCGQPAAHLVYALGDAALPRQPESVMRHGATSAIMGRSALETWSDVLPGQERTLLLASGDTCDHCVQLWDVRHGRYVAGACLGTRGGCSCASKSTVNRLLHNLRPMPEAVRQVQLRSVMDVCCVATLSESMLRLETLL